MSLIAYFCIDSCVAEQQISKKHVLAPKFPLPKSIPLSFHFAVIFTCEYIFLGFTSHHNGQALSISLTFDVHQCIHVCFVQFCFGFKKIPLNVAFRFINQHHYGQSTVRQFHVSFFLVSLLTAQYTPAKRQQMHISFSFYSKLTLFSLLNLCWIFNLLIVRFIIIIIWYDEVFSTPYVHFTIII